MKNSLEVTEYYELVALHKIRLMKLCTIIFCFVSLLVGISFISAIRNMKQTPLPDPTQWEVRDIAAYIDAPYSSLLIEVMNKSNRARDDSFISLILRGTESDIRKFAEAICSETLNRGYNPCTAPLRLDTKSELFN